MTAQDAYKKLQGESGIKVGHTVKILRAAKDNEMGWDNSWVGVMNETIGSTATVRSVNGAEGYNLSNGWQYPFFVLENQTPLKTRVEISTDYTADIKIDGSIEVGCQTITREKMQELVDRWQAVITA